MEIKNCRLRHYKYFDSKGKYLIKEEIEETIKNYDKRIGEITYIEEQYCPYFKLRYIK